MLESVKGALRVTSSDPVIVLEITDLIAGARMELIQAGVSIVNAANDEDPLIRRAIILYAKAHYGLDGPNAERFAESFESLKNHLSQAGDYRELV
ncbi:DNA-packaging protein [Sporosarcina sp. Sa2YVA2]|uniref:DNA-packaging protein n=1 Tax=Sporosarcina quadrami TaxID=2762234 RepID=A0ABR8U8Q1_9BACL|nr:DNA-packaging protein [Sporosarcina quadrami]MBD7984412.1 DNA-packaging protein [Sporosarcina quadrami]